MTREEIFKIMLTEYKNACRDFYETSYGCKVNAEYTIINRDTNKVVKGCISGCGKDETAASSMATIRSLMFQIFGDECKEILSEIRQEERRKEKHFFDEHPEFVYHVTPTLNIR